MKGLLRWAVTDGPDGLAHVTAPDDQLLARRLRVGHGDGFWCSRQGGGCGQKLTLKAGEERRPYFSHLPGSASCALAVEPGLAERSYEHLTYQVRLQQWLHGQGYACELEKHLAEDGRTDLHVVVEAVRHSIEVQLSPISDREVGDREQRYRQRVDKVTWLFGAAARSAAITQVAIKGWALLLRRGEDDVEVGVLDAVGEIWSPLGKCWMSRGGLCTPDLADVLERAAARLRQEQEARRRAAEEEAQRLEAQRAEEELRRRLREAATARQSQQPAAPPPASPRRPADGAGEALHHWTLAAKLRAHPEATDWTPDCGWGWLDGVDEGLWPAARLMAYMCGRIYASGPLGQLEFDDVADPDRVVAHALAEAGVITVLRHISGRQRWQRVGYGL